MTRLDTYEDRLHDCELVAERPAPDCHDVWASGSTR
jgi:hypothetical protein